MINKVNAANDADFGVYALAA